MDPLFVTGTIVMDAVLLIAGLFWAVLLIRSKSKNRELKAELSLQISVRRLLDEVLDLEIKIDRLKSKIEQPWIHSVTKLIFGNIPARILEVRKEVRDCGYDQEQIEDLDRTLYKLREDVNRAKDAVDADLKHERERQEDEPELVLEIIEDAVPADEPNGEGTGSGD